MKITIKQIAMEAGVSIGTVDRVLHDRGKVSKEKQSRILDICHKYDYEQNIVGKAMAMQKKQHTIAVIINSKAQNSFASQVYAGVNAIEAELKDYNIVFEYHDILNNTVEEQLELLSHLEMRDLSGLIIKPIDNPMIRLHLNKLAAQHVPVVFCTSDTNPVHKLCFVGQNHYQDGRLMANALSKFTQGSLQILMMVGPLQTNAKKARIDGFLSYMQEHSKDFNVCGICEVPYHREDAYSTILNSLHAHLDANAIYINTPDIDPCIDALENCSKFKGLRFCFGHREKVGPLILNGKIDFAVRESPFQHGHRAGEVIFRYLLSQEIPTPESCVFNGEIMLEENSRI